MSRAMFGVLPMGDNLQIRDEPTMVTRLCEAMWHSEARALQYAVPANCLLIGALSFLLPAGPLSAAMMLDAFLLAMAAVGITARTAVLIVPNIAIKILLLLIMLFIGCVSIDTFHANYMKESAGIFPDPEVVSQSPVSLWRNVVQTYPSLPLWTIAFILLICIEIRLFFCAWYKIAWRSNEDEGKKVEKHPPSYAYCISQGTADACSADDLPSYEEAVRRSSVQKPCCSKSLLPRSDSSRTILKASDSAQNEAQTPTSGNAKAQLKTQVQSHPQTNTNVSRITSSQPRPQRVVTIQIEQPPVETERRCGFLSRPSHRNYLEANYWMSF